MSVVNNPDYRGSIISTGCHMAERGDIDRIRELLRKHEKGLTIEEVASNLDINRSTASKYLNSLVFSGSATIRKLGPAKLFYLRETLPLDRLLDCTFDGVVVLDGDQVIQEVNSNALNFFNISQEEAKGKHATQSPLLPLFDPDTCRALGDLQELGGWEIEGPVDTWRGTLTLKRRLIPVQFQSGSHGSSLIFHVVLPGKGNDPAVGQTGDLHTSSYARTCRQAFQLNTLFRRFSQNQLSHAAETLREMGRLAGQDKIQEPIRELMQLIDNIRFHLGLLEEYLADDIMPPDWHPVDGILNRALSSRNLAHIRFFSDIRGIEIFTDRDCGRIFHTLLDNSAHHGKKVTSIRVTSVETAGGLLIAYTDDGIGIPDNEKPTLFEWGHGIHRAHSLFLSRQMLAVTDISIRENGTYGKGVRFEILVPAGRWRKGPLKQGAG